MKKDMRLLSKALSSTLKKTHDDYYVASQHHEAICELQIAQDWRHGD